MQLIKTHKVAMEEETKTIEKDLLVSRQVGSTIKNSVEAAELAKTISSALSAGNCNPAVVSESTDDFNSNQLHNMINAESPD